MIDKPARKQRRVRNRLQRRPPIASQTETKQIRDGLAARFLRGHGAEIGALNFPLGMPDGVEVTYVDYLPAAELREHHPYLERFVEPDVVDDGETLSTFADESLDFIVANHFIEHTEDPIRTIASHLRKLRPGGVLFLTVPDKRLTFDRDRPTTPPEHFLRDHRDGPQGSRQEHYLEWARVVDKVPPDEVEAAAQGNEERRFSIHFHTFTPTSFVALLGQAGQEEGLDFEVEHLEGNGLEFIVILRKAMPLGSASGEAGSELGALRRETERLNWKLSSIVDARSYKLAQGIQGPVGALRRIKGRLGSLRRSGA